MKIGVTTSLGSLPGCRKLGVVSRKTHRGRTCEAAAQERVPPRTRGTRPSSRDRVSGPRPSAMAAAGAEMGSDPAGGARFFCTAGRGLEPFLMREVQARLEATQVSRARRVPGSPGPASAGLRPGKDV